jgi:aryl-alcohol dehydrogenase-like predicted oxidoreductase
MTVSRKIGGRDVNPVGLGCMNVSWAYAAPPPPEEAAKLLNKALDLGYNHLDTARLYGGGKNELLLGEALKGRRHEFYLASKMGIFADGDRRYVDCKPETIRREVEISLKALQTDYIDLYYMHRRDFTVPLEDTAGCFADLIREGKVGGYGLSEFSADSLRKSHAVCPVTAVQTEYSLWTRNPELGVLAATAELGVALVAFSPLARGVLANGVRNPVKLEPQDLRRTHPRFNAEHWPKNLALVDQFNAIAMREGATPAQLSLAWVLSRGDHVHVIPGTTNPDHLAENIECPDWRPSDAVLAELDGLINRHTVSGPRYPAAMQATMDTEEFVD